MSSSLTNDITSVLINHHETDEALNDILKLIEPHLKKNKYTTLDDKIKSKSSKPKVTKIKYGGSDFKYPRARLGWSGPFKQYYLSKDATDEDGKKIKTIKNFNEAVEKAESLGESCSGITLTSTGYSLRVKCQLIECNRHPKGYASWIKGDVSVPKCSLLDDDDVLLLEDLAIEGGVIEPESEEESVSELNTISAHTETAGAAHRPFCAMTDL